MARERNRFNILSKLRFEIVKLKMSPKEKTINYDELAFDLKVICGGLPGRGNALKRLFSHCSGVTQQSVANALDIDRSTVSLWVSEKRWPAPKTLVDLLCFLSIDRAELATATEILLGSESTEAVLRDTHILSSKAVNTSQLLEILRSQDSDTQKEVIFNTYETKVLLCLAKKAAGERVPQHFSSKDSKSFFDEMRLFREQQRAHRSSSRRIPPNPNFRLGAERERLLAHQEERAEWIEQSTNKSVEDGGESE